MSQITLTELKALHESGGRASPKRQAAIKLQLKRACDNPECKTSLAFTRKGAFCSKKCSDRAAAIKRTENRQKKQRWEAKHGIVRKKSVKRNIVQTGVPVTEELLYENYKEPLKPVPKSQGFGFMGTIATTADHNMIQCHICGFLFTSLAGHLRKHRLNSKEYKEKFHLMASTALVGDEVRRSMQEQVFNKNTSITKGMPLPAHLMEYNRRVQSGEIRHKGSGNTWSLERRNKAGNCPDQVLDKIKELAEILGKTPSLNEFTAHYRSRYISAIVYQHGSWTKAVKKAKLVTRDELRKPDRDELLKELQDFFKKYKRIPMTSDFKREYLRDKGVFIRVFGSLNNARIEAGLNAVLPLPFGQVVELTPEQYMEYQAGHGLSKAAIAGRKKRAKKKIQAMTTEMGLV